jgi:hypothetical protein
MVEGLARGINYLHKLGYRILSGVGWRPLEGTKGKSTLGRISQGSG